jgi:hypothetical protein
MNTFLIFLFAILFVAPLGILHAQVPQLINYQGRVGVDGVNFDGSGQFKFAFVNATGTTTYWSNDNSSTAGSEPATAVGIPVSKGLYSILLGDATQAHMTIVPATVFVHGDVHLRVWFSDGVKGFQQLTPDRRIAAVGYALMADSVSDGAITTAKIADGAVTSEKLAAGVVQTSNLATGAVGNTKLANSALTINAGTGLGGGGLVSLGGNVSLTNSGVLSLTSGGGITVDAATGVVTLGSSATSANTASAIVARDASGNFTAGIITAALNGNANTATDATNFTGMLVGDVTGTQSATVVSSLGGLSAANIASGVALANNATAANTAGTFVKRDASGNFSAGTMTAEGNLSLSTTNAIGTAGVINLGGSRLIHSFGGGNFFAGTNSGNFSMTGVNNTSVGSASLSSNTLGSSNTGIGSLALNQNTTGLNNTAQGFMALRSNTTGNNNTGIGHQALQLNTTGNQNTSIGITSLQSNSTGGANTAVGALAMSQSVSGSGNTAVGWKALVVNTSGGNNVALGTEALLNFTLGNSNIAIGPGAGRELTTGNDNIIIGNPGVAGETGIIRIGTSGIHTNTHITGVIHGDGSGLSGVRPKIDRQKAFVNDVQSTIGSYSDLISLTTHNLGEAGCYMIRFSVICSNFGNGHGGNFVLNINGQDVAETESPNLQFIGESYDINYVANNVVSGTVIKVRFKGGGTTGYMTLSVSRSALTIDGAPQSMIE